MWDTAGLPVKPAADFTTPHGCPRFELRSVLRAKKDAQISLDPGIRKTSIWTTYCLAGSSVCPSSTEHFVHRRFEVMSGHRRRNPAAQDCPVRNVSAVERGRVSRVLVHFITGQIDTGKQTFAAGI